MPHDPIQSSSPPGSPPGPHPAAARRRAQSAGHERRVFWVMWLTGGFMLLEGFGGWIAGSLALVADAGHMLSDTAALALAWLAFRWTHRPSDRHRTYGYDRLQILAAFTNGIALVVLALWIVIEAVGRLLEPTPVMGGIMITIAAAGLAVNVVAFLILREGAADNLNLRGALAHVLGDLLGSLAALAAGAVVIRTGWTPIDPLLSVLVAGLILRSAVDLVRRSGHILMEGTPEGLDPNELAVFLQREIPDVLNVHHVHAWSLTNERPMVTLQADVTLDADVNLVTAEIVERLSTRYGLDHVTVQVSPAPGETEATTARRAGTSLP